MFVYEAGDEADRIVDFEDGLDLLDLSDFSGAQIAAALAGITQVGTSAVLDFGGGDTLTLVGTDIADVDIADVM